MHRFDEALFADEATKERIIQELVSEPDRTLKAMISILETGPKMRWKLAVQIIRAIGYPHNVAAIPRLIEHVGNINSPYWDEIVQALAEMDSHVVIPYLLLFLLDKSQHEYWEADVEGVCWMLQKIDRTYALACGPTMVYLLSQENLYRKLDVTLLLDVLEKIGPECAEYALPALINLVHQEGANAVHTQARHLIDSFSEEAREPYKYLLASS